MTRSANAIAHVLPQMPVLPLGRIIGWRRAEVMGCWAICGAVADLRGHDGAFAVRRE
ncbi:hypothetical protein [Natronohydrobacter thiooxidans]|uniref:hypothetical protein n=1 Tax=Natronohydrobacter thiooxidans TaxID=87172 RepID=UPI001587D3C6|nr:hypothetical protein [Natronohydrobacter thiooxidans]